ncbi:TetR/AcrR family transcriptional regulator [Actibacterium lipolyticum]|uniref:HTH-type transcriptional repressor KstR2 n=1 Tax=Actibacterium lipolyticum TaxID=1524263 RepID=A0A238L7N2_9RHOB|nr:TetR/AcrR family transcriptional regulator [Actibacterium lipolyticum]SMX51095.1 HTH-type transcriptional repressor KstR2 [Actibacterium lipolyticum]
MARKIAPDYNAKRALILKTAAQVFAEHGYDRASLNQLAGACDISKANIYHYYGSKEDILFAILDGYLMALRDRICGLNIATLSAPDQLRATVSEVLLAYQGADHEHRLQTMALDALPADRQDILRGYQRDLIRHLSRIMRTVAPEVFGTDAAKLRSATMSVFGMMNWFYMWNRSADEKARMDYAKLVSNMVLDGVQGL